MSELQDEADTRLLVSIRKDSRFPSRIRTCRRSPSSSECLPCISPKETIAPLARNQLIQKNRLRPRSKWKRPIIDVCQLTINLDSKPAPSGNLQRDLPGLKRSSHRIIKSVYDRTDRFGGGYGTC